MRSAQYKFYDSASSEWWKNKGSVPLKHIAKKYKLSFRYLSTIIIRQIADKSGVELKEPEVLIERYPMFEKQSAILPSQLKKWEDAYYERYPDRKQ